MRSSSVMRWARVRPTARFRPILLKNSLQRLRRFLRRERVKGRIGRRHAPERTHRLGEPLTV